MSDKKISFCFYWIPILIIGKMRPQQEVRWTKEPFSFNMRQLGTLNPKFMDYSRWIWKINYIHVYKGFITLRFTRGQPGVTRKFTDYGKRKVKQWSPRITRGKPRVTRSSLVYFHTTETIIKSIVILLLNVRIAMTIKLFKQQTNIGCNDNLRNVSMVLSCQWSSLTRSWALLGMGGFTGIPGMALPHRLWISSKTLFLFPPSLVTWETEEI